MSPDLEQRFEQLAQLISGVSESLHREMQDGFRQMNKRTDVVEVRVNRHGALLQTGARWTARMTKWCEDTDRLMLDRDKRIADLEQRVRELERKRNGHN
jgi:BMFP domain-containing protein YqiC